MTESTRTRTTQHPAVAMVTIDCAEVKPMLDPAGHPFCLARWGR